MLTKLLNNIKNNNKNIEINKKDTIGKRIIFRLENRMNKLIYAIT